MAVDAAGNAYIAGVRSPEGMPDMVTIKYGPTGAQAWVNIYGTDTAMEYPTDIEVDAAGNVYVYAATGHVAHSDLALFKFNSAGVQQWMRTFDGAVLDYPGQMTVDGRGKHLSHRREGMFFVVTVSHSQVRSGGQFTLVQSISRRGTGRFGGQDE